MSRGDALRTQRALVMQALQAAGEKGCCLDDFAKIDFGLPYRARNVVSDLRKDHIPIRSEVCKVHKHRSSVARYFYAPVGQLALRV